MRRAPRSFAGTKCVSALMEQSVREKSRLGPFLDEVQGFLFLLRRHSFLRYQVDLREYNVRRMVVIDGIVKALGRITSVSLPVVYDEIPVEDLQEVSIAFIQKFMRQTIRNMKRSLHSLESRSSNTNGYGQAIHQWEKALQALGECVHYAARASNGP